MSRSSELDYHLARVLLLVNAFSVADGTGIDGLTKLAKLDFLLRYPVLTDRLLELRGRSWPLGAQPTEAEHLAVESRMIRYKYGPWDDRYYPILGSLLGTQLVAAGSGRGRLTVRATAVGNEVARALAASPEWSTIASRCELLADVFDEPGSVLKDLIYENLPSVTDRPHRSVI